MLDNALYIHYTLFSFARWLREPNYILALYYLVAARVRKQNTPDSNVARSTKAGVTLARGT